MSGFLLPPVHGVLGVITERRGWWVRVKWFGPKRAIRGLKTVIQAKGIRELRRGAARRESLRA